jgi:hypothetical protein
MTVGSGVQAFPGNDEFVGQNPPEAASIVYYQRRRHVFGDMRVEILDAKGDVLTTLGAGKLRGMNRVDWPMRLPMPKMPAATSLAPVFQGPLVEEGAYKFRIVKGSKTYEGSVTLVPDPRADYTPDDRQLQQRTALALYGMLERLTYVVEATTDLRDQARRAADSTRGGTARNLRRLADSLEAFRTGLVATSEAGQLSGDEKLREHLGNLFGSVNGYAGKPTGSELERLDILRRRLDDAVARFRGLTGEARLAPLNRSLQSGGHAPLTVLSEDAWRSRSEPGGGGNTGSTR